jgi:hypothetical protein
MVLGGDSDLDWPSLDDLKTLLDVTSTDAHDGQLQAFLDAAIAQTKTKRGNWDEMTDLPDAALAASALMRAYELASADATVIEARKSEQLLYDHRTRFGMA